MTRNKETYRLKGRAVFLAAIMVISVLAMPIAFAGGAAALDPTEDNYDGELAANSTVYQGQILAADVSDGAADVEYSGLTDNDDLELRRVDSDGDIAGLVSTPSVVQSGGETYVIVDTENRDNDQYILTEKNRGETADGNEEYVFEVVEQQLTAEFDDESVADSGDDAETTFEIESEIRNSYAVNISADGLDDSDLVNIFGLEDFDDRSGEFDDRSDIAQATINTNSTEWATIDEDDEVLTLVRGEAEWNVDFDEIDEGEYEFEVDVVDSTATASDSIEVEDRGDGEATVEAAEVFQGDVVEFEVELDNTDNAILVIGDEDDDGYQANVSIEDADEDTVSVFFNTYAAGQTADQDDIIFGDSDQDATVALENMNDEQDISALLDSGDYTVYSGAVDNTNFDGSDFYDVVDDPDEITTLTINDRSELDATQWRAGEDTIDALTDELDDEDEEAAVELISEVEGELVTETDMFAVNDGDGSGDSDYQIHQISASGLHGAIAVADTTNNLDDIDTVAGFEAVLGLDNQRHDGGLDDDYSVVFELEQQNPGSNQDPIEISLNEIADGTQSGDVTDFVETIIYDENANDYYVVIDTDELISFADTELTEDIEEDQEYEVTFAVQDARLLDETDQQDDLEDLYEEVNWEFDLDEAEGEFLNMNDNDEVEAEAGEDSEITVDTNVAPGTELDIRARNAPGTSPSFIKNDRDVVVGADGLVTGVFDFSSQTPDEDEFEASVRQASFELEEDGVFVDVVEDEEPVDDDEEPVDDEEEPVDDEEEPVDDDEVDDDTDDETPGFGALVALVALLGAALLAARRQN